MKTCIAGVSDENSTRLCTIFARTPYPKGSRFFCANKTRLEKGAGNRKDDVAVAVTAELVSAREHGLQDSADKGGRHVKGGILADIGLLGAAVGRRRVYAQEPTGTITGTIRDESGGVIPNAKDNTYKQGPWRYACGYG